MWIENITKIKNIKIAQTLLNKIGIRASYGATAIENKLGILNFREGGRARKADSPICKHNNFRIDFQIKLIWRGFIQIFIKIGYEIQILEF